MRVLSTSKTHRHFPFSGYAYFPYSLGAANFSWRPEHVTNRERHWKALNLQETKIYHADRRPSPLTNDQNVVTPWPPQASLPGLQWATRPGRVPLAMAQKALRIHQFDQLIKPLGKADPPRLKQRWRQGTLQHQGGGQPRPAITAQRHLLDRMPGHCMSKRYIIRILHFRCHIA